MSRKKPTPLHLTKHQQHALFLKGALDAVQPNYLAPAHPDASPQVLTRIDICIEVRLSAGPKDPFAFATQAPPAGFRSRRHLPPHLLLIRYRTTVPMDVFSDTGTRSLAQMFRPPSSLDLNRITVVPYGSGRLCQGFRWHVAAHDPALLFSLMCNMGQAGRGTACVARTQTPQGLRPSRLSIGNFPCPEGIPRETNFRLTHALLACPDGIARKKGDPL